MTLVKCSALLCKSCTHPHKQTSSIAITNPTRPRRMALAVMLCLISVQQQVVSCWLMQQAAAGAHIKARESPVQGVPLSSHGQHAARPSPELQACMLPCLQLLDVARVLAHQGRFILAPELRACMPPSNCKHGTACGMHACSSGEGRATCWLLGATPCTRLSRAFICAPAPACCIKQQETTISKHKMTASGMRQSGRVGFVMAMLVVCLCR
jgi:hypothetical protein